VFSVKKAINAQRSLSKLVSEVTSFNKVETIAGVDAAYLGDVGIGASVVLDYNTLKPLERAVSTRKIKVPYIPTLFAFRELPVILNALKKLSISPDVVMVDGHGCVHPRRFGLACHLGVVLDKPTVGVAKKPLYGKEFNNLIYDEDDGVIGAVLPVRGKKLYISVGHKVSLSDAIEIVRRCMVNRLPEPIRLAHETASKVRRELSC